ncbi:hypothetical protein EWM64_g3216 [Hericium alpestre]|uniref:F-box domain-containing protein n=1 Tax=Hericium alpestre TaxID=135208 RepID=A0A4Z0A133_9AGAM|nr:hypothetical protein EWM64_g3216 [Hericium alpestre]
MSSQYWILLNLDTRDTLPHYGRLEDGLFHIPALLVNLLQIKKAVTLLAGPEPVNPKLLKLRAKFSAEFGWNRFRAAPDFGAPAFFERLPTEIIYMIVNELTNDCVNCICLALCNRRLWSIARGVIEKTLHDFDRLNSWAGGRLICAGDDQETDDLPPGVFDDGELDALRNEDGDLESICFVAWNWDIPRLYLEPSDRHTFIEESLETRGLTPYHQDWDLWKSLKGPEFFQDRVCENPSPDNPRLLRNLTTHEYVCDSVLLEWNKLLSEYNDVERKLDQLDDGVNVVNPVTLVARRTSTGAVWAGHRFDIVLATELVEMEKEKEKAWKDVSSEVMNDMEQVWEMVVPFGWQDLHRSN